jgi:3-oxoacyl-[acyl-carrier-protein] synthase-1
LLPPIRRERTREGPKARRSLRGAQGDVVHLLGGARHLVQDQGLSYSISSACATSAHCIGNAAELIQWGKQDIMFAGGGEELDWSLSVLFDAMGALSSRYNDTPERASRAYDKNRDGFVIAGGGGVVVLEELERAKARGAKIYAELVGYGATPTATTWSPLRRRRGALHAPGDCRQSKRRSTTSTRMAHRRRRRRHRNRRDARSVRQAHAAGEFDQIADRPQPRRRGVHEAIYSILQMQSGFIAESAISTRSIRKSPTRPLCATASTMRNSKR